MQIIKTDFEDSGFALRTVLRLATGSGVFAEFGAVKFPRGYRQPKDGVSVHDRDEISLVVQGRLTIECDGRNMEVVPGDLVHIPAGQSHATEALEESQVYFALIDARPEHTALGR